ncbi:hypothetical protein AGMMS49545_04140 [Betaproteobacteria bacterium]|nr:hypothetical protein AGMMS49545_04140 [Betaproteobacteria bacterium]GHU43087.1 hypothetical protein AGMMS50289_08910 [Betaproteobacteria bacterium]
MFNKHIALFVESKRLDKNKNGMEKIGDDFYRLTIKNVGNIPRYDCCSFHFPDVKIYRLVIAGTYKVYLKKIAK